LAIRQNVLGALAIFVLALFVYQSNGDTYLYAYDSAPNSLLVFNLIDHGRVDFENFRGGYFTGFGASYIFIDARDGKLASLFPVGTAILTAPLYAAFDVERRVLHQPFDITQPAFERYRLHYEKEAASIVAALAAVLLFLCARRIGATLFAAATVTAFFAFGTEMWAIGSQALWQHGPVNLVVLAMIYAFLAAGDTTEAAARTRWLVVAGVCAGFLPVVRPTSVLFLVAAAVFAVWSARTRSRFFAYGALIGIAPGIAWNLYFFHTFVGGYLGNTGNYVASLSFAGTALAGLLVSPSKGLAITTPLVVFSIAGVIGAARSRTPAGRLLFALALASLALVGTYAFYVGWWGGTNFGDRFLSDTAAICALLLLYAIPRNLLATMAFAVLLIVSIGVQFAGANGEMESEWTNVPLDANTHPARLWSWSDGQILRDAVATYRKFSANPTSSTAYRRGFVARVTAVRAFAAASPGVLTVAAGQPFDVIATLENRGSSPLYGYTTGVWAGQARVRVQIQNAAGVVLTSGTLYVAGFDPTQAQADAIGTVVAPAAPGAYELQAQAYLNRIDGPGGAEPPAMAVPMRVP
jgi:hypothetical protein